jgi:hypothetical protein
MRDLDTIDAELRLVAALRRAPRDNRRPANCTRVKLDCSTTLYQCVLVIHRYSWVLM